MWYSTIENGIFTLLTDSQIVGYIFVLLAQLGSGSLNQKHNISHSMDSNWANLDSWNFIIIYNNINIVYTIIY